MPKNVKSFIAITVVVGLIMILFMVGIWSWSADQIRSEVQRADCEQYLAVPEDHIELIPHACIGQYYQARSVPQ